MGAIGLAESGGSARAVDPSIYRKVIWRILPFMFVAYVVNQLDRTNISFAKLRFMSDIGLNEAAYGLGAGLFFIGYVAFEVPSNLYLQRTGARATFIRIMVLWGVLSMATALVQTPAQLYIARFFLGAAEAGFVPGAILYLTYWFPSEYRGRISSLFFMAIAFAGICGGPLSGWILRSFDGLAGLKDWQWLFLVEGAPSAVLGLLAYFWLDDHPAEATWLTDVEKETIRRDLEVNPTSGHKVGSSEPNFRAALRDPRVYIAALVYFSIIAGNNALTLWIPSIISGFGIHDVFHVGLLSSIPYTAGAIFMFVAARHSDRKRERRWHTSLAILTSGFSFVLLGSFLHSPVIATLLLVTAAIGIYTAISIFWTIPPSYLTGDAAAGGIALVSSIGMFGGFFSPIILGYAKSLSGSLQIGFWAIAAMLAAGALALIIGIPKQRQVAPGDARSGEMRGSPPTESLAQ